MIAVNCINCNKEVKRFQKDIKRVKNNFCSRKCSGEFQRLYLVGQKFGELEVLEFDCIKNHKSYFKCRCKCKRIISVCGTDLKRSINPKCKKCSRRKYVGEISGWYFKDIKRGANKRNMPFKITQSNIWEKFLEQNRKCAYSGLELNWQDGCKGELGTASVDRINPGIGYTKENIRIIHKDINRIKIDYEQDYFLYLCDKIANFDRKFYPILDYRSIKKHKNWKGFGEISGNYWRIIKNGSKRNKNRNIEFAITIEYAWDIYLQQGGVCALSGLPIKFEASYINTSEKTSSLDRINSSIGYVKGNIQWVHKDINRMKWDFTEEYLIYICELITKLNKLNKDRYKL